MSHQWASETSKKWTLARLQIGRRSQQVECQSLRPRLRTRATISRRHTSQHHDQCIWRVAVTCSRRACKCELFSRTTIYDSWMRHVSVIPARCGINETYPNNNANPIGKVQINMLQPTSVFETNATTEPNISTPPMHMEIKNTPLEAIITLDCRLYEDY